MPWARCCVRHDICKCTSFVERGGRRTYFIGLCSARCDCQATRQLGTCAGGAYGGSGPPFLPNRRAEFAEHDLSEARFEALVWEEQRLKARSEAQRRLGRHHADLMTISVVAAKVVLANSQQRKNLPDVIPSCTRRTNADLGTVMLL